MAIVFLAHDLKHDRQVALKVLRPELSEHLGAERFLREVRIAAKLTHPHILPLHDSGEAAGFLYYVMPFIEGESLRQRLDREGELPVSEAAGILREVVDALAYAHQQGVVHRDIKPDNVMLSGRHAVVTDFGIAKAVSQATGAHDITSVGVAMGTPSYMAPEQATAEAVIDHRADIYAVGALAYELLTGRPPFTGATSQAILAAHVTQAPEPISRRRAAVPPALELVIMRCLEKRAADRWQSAEELIPHFDAARTPSGGTTPPPASLRDRRRRAWIVAGVAAGVVAAIALVGGLIVRTRDGGTPSTGVAAAGAMRSIAVLPFANVSGDADDEYFADGMTDELIAGLGKVAQLRVAARGSAFQFKGRSVDAREVGRLLNVTSVLEGSVRRSGNRIRLSASLVNAADGLQLWSHSYEREDGDVFALQDELAAAIVSELELQLGGAELAAARAGRTKDPVAQELYLRGRFQSTQLGESELRRGLDFFEQALARDPNFARAYAGIAFIHVALADAYVKPSVAYPLARNAALAALQRDSLVADAHAALGYADAVLTRDIGSATRQLRRAMELDPNSSFAPFLLSNLLCLGDGQFEESLRLIDAAIELDPLPGILHWQKQACLLVAGRTDDLIAGFAGTAAADFVYIDSWLAAAYRAKGRYDDAVREYRRVDALVGGEPLYGLAITFAKMGRPREARAVLVRVEEKARRSYVSPSLIAMTYAALGDTAAAIAVAEAAVRDRDPSFFFFQRIPDAVPLFRIARVRQLMVEDSARTRR